MPAPHHSVFYMPDAVPAAQPTASKQKKREKERYDIAACQKHTNYEQ